MKTIILSTTLILFIAAGCNKISQNNPEKNSPPAVAGTPVPEFKPTNVLDTASWQTCSIPNIGVSFRYPNNWQERGNCTILEPKGKKYSRQEPAEGGPPANEIDLEGLVHVNDYDLAPGLKFEDSALSKQPKYLVNGNLGYPWVIYSEIEPTFNFPLSSTNIVSFEDQSRLILDNLSASNPYHDIFQNIVASVQIIKH